MFRLLLFCCALQLSFGQAQPASPVPPNVKQKILDDLRRAPDYTCSELIEHKVKQSGASFVSLDRIRLEVSYAAGKEIFGWTGGDRVSDDDLPRLVSATISNSDFAMHPRVILTNSRVQFSDPVDQKSGDQDGIRIDFRVAAASSDWTLSAGGNDVRVPYHGSIQIGKRSGRLTQLELITDSVPPALGYTSVGKRLFYNEVQLGTGKVLLPARSELFTAAPNGQETLNETRYSECRPYAASAEAAHVSPAELPNEINVDLVLETPVDSDSAAIGDPIIARVQQAIKRKKETVVPKGATLHGRISTLELVQGYRIVDFVFTHFEVDGDRIDIRNRSNMVELEDRYTMGDKVMVNQKMGPMSGKNVYTVATRMPGPIRVNSARARIPRGFKLYLRSNVSGGS